MSITSVISYTTLICSEWSVRISCTTFRWWYPIIFSVLGGTSAIQLCGRFVSVSGPLQVPGIETKEDSCRWPSTHEVANRHTQLSAGISMSDSPTTYRVVWTRTTVGKRYSSGGRRICDFKKKCDSNGKRLSKTKHSTQTDFWPLVPYFTMLLYFLNCFCLFLFFLL